MSQELLDVLLGPLGLLAFLLIGVVWGGVRKAWVWGWQYRELKAECDEWKALAMKSAGTAEKAANAAQTVIGTTVGLTDEDLLRAIRDRGAR